MFEGLFARYRLQAREARFIRLALLLAAGLNLLAWWLALSFALPRLATSPFFALHYTVYFGVDQIGAPWKLVFLPVLGLGIFLVDACVAVRLFRRERLTSAYIAVVALLSEALLTVVTFLTILLNT